ncbi:tyrosyl-tRNA synthetase-like protein [Pleomassaria siparia CBS 279.74]|uniref:Tyrosine--tRNA ligase n=1 Tax=Pleomassaria siparia CBS 279.74 TaxID=1314801 RepID=A0A6G1KAW5_9PLEO|nr:tyrosyl-tRNA synthetase-like protein [Pleomassaria siparia CBS 279.74]
MSLLTHLPRHRQLVCRQCLHNRRQALPLALSKRSITTKQDAEQIRRAEWETQARRIRSGAQKSMLTVLEERGFVKDVAGGRKALDWLLTEKRIGAYVGVDPTAPSLHVGHLLPLMALYWMYFYGFNTVTLFGGCTVQIGDPSGRKTARTRQGADVQAMNVQSIEAQLRKLWIHVKCLGIKHRYPIQTSADNHQKVLDNGSWLKGLTAVDLMKDLGSGMRLGAMLSRDSVRQRTESGDGMAISEFCYPLFQAYDWWHMYSQKGVQLQLGGSDQYGNICAGMDAVNHMRKLRRGENERQVDEDVLTATFGLTTPLLTTASGEKFGKSAGNAVWLDQTMMSSFDLYQYFLRTSDDDVERYLKLFTFIPIDYIYLVMEKQRKDAGKRVAQHLLAKEIVELAHGAASAKKAEVAHKEAFSDGTRTFSLSALRKTLSNGTIVDVPTSSNMIEPTESDRALKLTDYKRGFIAATQAPSTATDSSIDDVANSVVTIPSTLLRVGTFPRILHAAGLVASRNEGHKLIKSKGAYVVVPNSGTVENPHGLKWEQVPEGTSIDPNHYLVDWEALVVRSGKSKFQVCRIISEERFEAEGMTCPGWEDFKAKRAEQAAAGKDQ